MDPGFLWSRLLPNYLFTIAVETPILLLGLSRRHSLKRRVFCGVWLTACTYPIVGLVLPLLIDPGEQRWLYLLVAETFAPVAECALFWAAYGEKAEWGRPSMWQDLGAIVLANLASFGAGEVKNRWEQPQPGGSAAHRARHQAPMAPTATRPSAAAAKSRYRSQPAGRGSFTTGVCPLLGRAIEDGGRTAEPGPLWMRLDEVEVEDLTFRVESAPRVAAGHSCGISSSDGGSMGVAVHGASASITSSGDW